MVRTISGLFFIAISGNIFYENNDTIFLIFNYFNPATTKNQMVMDFLMEGVDRVALKSSISHGLNTLESNQKFKFKNVGWFFLPDNYIQRSIERDVFFFLTKVFECMGVYVFVYV